MDRLSQHLSFLFLSFFSRSMKPRPTTWGVLNQSLLLSLWLPICDSGTSEFPAVCTLGTHLQRACLDVLFTAHVLKMCRCRSVGKFAKGVPAPGKLNKLVLVAGQTPAHQLISTSLMMFLETAGDTAPHSFAHLFYNVPSKTIQTYWHRRYRHIGTDPKPELMKNSTPNLGFSSPVDLKSPDRVRVAYTPLGCYQESFVSARSSAGAMGSAVLSASVGRAIPS